MRRSKKTSKLRVTSHCAGISPETGDFPAQMASNAENVSIWWRHQTDIGYGDWMKWQQWHALCIDWLHAPMGLLAYLRYRYNYPVRYHYDTVHDMFYFAGSWCVQYRIIMDRTIREPGCTNFRNPLITQILCYKHFDSKQNVFIATWHRKCALELYAFHVATTKFEQLNISVTTNLIKKILYNYTVYACCMC